MIVAALSFGTPLLSLGSRGLVLAQAEASVIARHGTTFRRVQFPAGQNLTLNGNPIYLQDQP